MRLSSLVKLYHNPQCPKSCETLTLIKSYGLEPHIIDYLNAPPSREEILVLLNLLSLNTVRDLLRKKEPTYAALNLSDPTLSDHELLAAVEQNPILLERPIVVCQNAARIGRPPENVLAILPIC